MAIDLTKIARDHAARQSQKTSTSSGRKSKARLLDDEGKIDLTGIALAHKKGLRLYEDEEYASNTPESRLDMDYVNGMSSWVQDTGRRLSSLYASANRETTPWGQANQLASRTDNVDELLQAAYDYADYIQNNESDLSSVLGRGTLTQLEQGINDTIANLMRYNRQASEANRGSLGAVNRYLATEEGRAQIQPYLDAQEEAQRQQEERAQESGRPVSSAALDAARQAIQVERQDVSRALQSDFGTDEYNAAFERLQQIDQDVDRLNTAIDEARDRENMQRWSSVMQNPDFAEYSQRGAEIHNDPAPSNRYALWNPTGWWGETFGPEVGNIVTYMRDNAETIRNSFAPVWAQGGDGERANTFNPISMMNQEHESPLFLYTQMTDEEVSVYNYLLAHDQEDGTNNAAQYLESLTPTLSERQGLSDIRTAQMYAAENPVGASAGSVAASLYSPLSFAEAVGNRIVGQETDPYGLGQMVTRLPRAARSQVSTNIQEGVNEATGQEVLGDTASWLYDLGMSLLDSALATGVGSALGAGTAVGTAIMGTSAATNAYQDAIDRGVNENRAIAAGGAAGLAEAFFERFSIDNFLKIVSMGEKRAFVKSVLRQMKVEASEEALTEISNIITDTLIMNDLSNYQLAIDEYVAQGMDESEARARAFGDLALQVGEAALGGAISGGAMGTAGSAISAARSRSMANSAIQNNAVDALIDAGLQLDENSNAYAVAQQLRNNQLDPTSAGDVARLVRGLAQDGALTNDLVQRIGETQEQESNTMQETAADIASTQDVEVDLLMQAATAVVDEQDQTRTARTETPSEAVRQETPSQTAQTAPESVPADGGTNTQVQAENGREAVLRRARQATASTAVPSSARLAAQNTQTQEDVTVSGFDDVFPDGSATLRTEDGSVVALGDVQFSDPLQQQLYESAVETGNVNAARTFVGYYDSSDGGNIASYAHGFYAIYNRALEGASFEQAVSGSVASDALTPVQQRAAYMAGQNVLNAAQGTQDTVQQAAPAEASPSAPATPKRRRTGGRPGLTRQFKDSSLSDSQRAALAENKEALRVIDHLAKVAGAEVVLVPSIDGLEVSGRTIHAQANGMYDPESGRIYIGIDAQEGALAYVATHELVHYIRAWNENGYNNLAGVVSEALSDAGRNMQDLIQYQMDRFGYDEDAAREEVIANSVPAILSDSAYVERIARKDMGLAKKIQQFIRNLTRQLRKQFDAIVSGSRSWAQMASLAENLDMLHDIENAFDVALSGVGQYVEYNQGAIKRKFSRKSWEESDKTDLVNRLSNLHGVSREQAQKWVSDVDSISAIVADEDNREWLDYTPDTNRKFLKPNAEYFFTLDASTLCAKRLLYQGIYNAIQHQLKNTTLTAEDAINIRNLMAVHGVVAPCAICYVESRRKHLGAFTEKWRRSYDGDYKPSIDELTTTDGLARLRREHPEVFDDFTGAMLRKGSSNPKVVELRTDYRDHDILRLTDTAVNKIKHIGGLHVQSFSDFEVVHMIDVMQAVLDMSARELTSQAYTKVPSFAWVFGGTGMKINLSLIAGGVDSSGKLIFDEYEGMKFRDAVALREAYSRDVGTIVVVRTDEEFRAAMADPQIDFIIPFHRSGWSQEQYRRLNRGQNVSDYTQYQVEKYAARNAKGKLVWRNAPTQLYPADYWDYTKTGKQNAERYLELCAERKVRPKFHTMLEAVSVGENPVYRLPADGSADGYWKTLIDYKMYDNDGNPAPQQAVRPNFNMERAQDILSQYLDYARELGLRADTLPVDNQIVDEFVRAKRAGQSTRNADVQSWASEDTLQDAAQESSAPYRPFEYGHEALPSGGRFSLRDTEPADVNRLRRQNERLAKALDNARRQVRIITGSRIDPDRLQRIARRFVRQYKSKYSSETLANELRQIYTYVEAGGENADWTDVDAFGIGVARKVVENAVERDDSISSQFADLRDYFQKTPLKLSDTLRRQIENSFGSVSAFRREVGNRIRFSDKGVELDVALGEIRDMYPFLDYESMDIDTLMELAELTRPAYVNPFGDDLESAAADLWTQLQEAYVDAAVPQTFAERKKAQIDQLKAEMRQMRKDNDLAARMAVGRARAEGQRALQEARAEWRRQMQERRASQTERAERRKYRERILASARTLSDWLTAPNDKRFVPEYLRNAVAQYIANVDVSYRANTKARDQWTNRMLNMLNAVHRASTAPPDSNPDLEFDAETLQNINELTALLRNAPMNKAQKEMTVEEMKMLSDTLQAIKHQIINADKLFVNGRRESIVTVGEDTINRALAQAEKKGNDRIKKIAGNKWITQMIKPYFYFRRLGGRLETLGKDLFRGESEVGEILLAERNWHEKIAEKYHLDRWMNRSKDTLNFTTEGGDKVSMTRGQALYVYEADKRERLESGTNHLRGGGIVFETDRKGKAIDTSVAVKLSNGDIQRIIDWLTDEQKAYADELVNNLSTTMAAYGNRTSMRLVGYKKFTGEHYIPFRVASGYTAQHTGEAAQPGGAAPQQSARLKNRGFTKNITQNANNPLVASDIFDVWGRHVQDMANYAALAIPQDNLIRVYNYRRPADAGGRYTTVQSAMINGYGNEMRLYLDRLNADIGGTLLVDPRDSTTAKWTSRFKKGAVMASFSVAVQQPTAFFRAFGVMPWRDIRMVINPLEGMRLFREAQRYAGTAVLKDIGGFDLQTGGGATDWLLGTGPQGIVEWSDEIGGFLPEKLDAITWGAIWKSVKQNVRRTTKLRPGSQAFFEECGKRFDDVIRLTQVYDSTLSRADIMRGRSQYLSMVTSFMAEPITTLNLELDTVLNAKRRDMQDRLSVRAVSSALISSTVINAIVRSAIYAMRDDDDEKTFGEKWRQEVQEALLGSPIKQIPGPLGHVAGFLVGSDFSPIGQMPILSDIASLVQGYDVMRTDMDVFSDVVTAVYNLLNSDTRTMYAKIRDLVGAVSQFSGVPVGNLWRDVEALLRSVNVPLPSDTTNEATQTGSFQRAYQALVDGDRTGYQRYMDRAESLIREGMDKRIEEDGVTYLDYETEVQNRLVRGLRDALKADPRIAEMAGYLTDEGWDVEAYERLRAQLVREGFPEAAITGAVNSARNDLEDTGEIESTPYNPEEWTQEDLQTAIEEAMTTGDTSEVEAIQQAMLTQTDTYWSVMPQDPADYVRSAARKAYQAASNDPNDRQAIEVLELFGYTQEDAQGWENDAMRQEVYTSIDAGDYSAANAQIQSMKQNGMKQESIRDGIRTKYKKQIQDAQIAGDTQRVRELRSTLMNLNLYDANGSLYFSAARIDEWIRDAGKEE